MTVPALTIISIGLQFASVSGVSSRRQDIGSRKIIALEQQREVAVLRERIGCAVAEIEGGGVAASAIAQKSGSRSLCKFCILGHHLDFRPGDQRVELRP